MAVIRADIPIWAGLLVTVLAVTALLARHLVYAHVERSLAAGMGDLPNVNAVLRVVLRVGFVLVAGAWALAGLVVVVLNLTGSVGD